MENNFDDKLVRKFRESLENYPVNCPPEAWREFERYYLRKPPLLIALRRKYLPYVAAVVAITIISALFAVIYYQQKPTEASAVIGQTVPPEEPHTAVGSPADKNAPESASKPLPELLQTEISPPKSFSKPSRKPTPESVVPIKSAADRKQAAAVLSQTSRTFSEQSKDKEMLTLAPISPLPLIDNFPHPTVVPALQPFEPTESSGTKQAKVVKVLPGMQALAGMIKGQDVQKPVAFYGAGGGAELVLQPRLSLTASLQFVQTAYETPEKRFKVFNSVQRDPTGRQQFAPVYAEEVEYSRVRLNLIQFPLTFKYRVSKYLFFNIGSISYMSAAGSRSERVVQNTMMGRLHNSVKTSDGTFRPFGSVYASGGVRIPLQGVVLQAEPYFNLPLGNLVQDLPHTSLQWIGLHVGLYYNGN